MIEREATDGQPFGEEDVEHPESLVDERSLVLIVVEEDRGAAAVDLPKDAITKVIVQLPIAIASPLGMLVQGISNSVVPGRAKRKGHRPKGGSDPLDIVQCILAGTNHPAL